MPNVQRFGNYILLKKIATGGMAELYKAKKSGEQGFEKLLAIKLILPNLSTNEDFITMFIDEAKVAALLNHQNIVQIYDLGKIEDSYCIVMEYVRGKDLKSVISHGLKSRKRLGVEHACHITSSVLAGLSYAHRKKEKGQDLKIVHRDISPQNVLISYEGEVKIVDFGIAKAATQSRETKVGLLKGKISYMSPEQARGKPLDMRSDIFSTGIVLYEMLTGKKLFQGDTDLNSLEKVREAKVEPLPTALNKSVPKELEDITLRALALEPADRYQTASEMDEALQSFMRKSGYSTGNYLSLYMSELFRDDIEEELREEEEWDHTLAPSPLAEDTLTSSTLAAHTKPVHKPEAVPVKPLLAAKAPAVSRPLQPNTREPKRGAPAWLMVAALFLVVVAGGAFWLKFKDAGQAETPQPQTLAAAAVAAPESPRPEQATEAQAAATLPQPTSPPVEPVENRPEPAPEKSRPPREPSAAAQPAPPAKSSLKVNSDPPGAEVFVDGEDTGRSTPATIDGLSPDRPYKVHVALNGYGSYDETVTPQPGRTAGVRATLTQQLGSFTIDAKPWFFVVVDGDNKGTTPLAGIKLSAGEHNMMIANPRMKIKKQMKLRIEANKTTSILIDWKNDPPVKEIIR